MQLRRILGPALISVIAGTLAIGCTVSPPDPGPTTRASASSAPTSSRPVSPASKTTDQARAVGLIDIRDALPDALLDLRYATANNFVGVQLYPTGARCLVHESLRPGLLTAATTLRSGGEKLVFWDCYRPHSVQRRMFDKVPNPAWVAAPGPYSRSHESGRSVDVTLATKTTDCPAERRLPDHCRMDMGTDFDSFTPEATAFATAGVSPSAQTARARLRAAMSAGGLTVYSGEWWHFDGPGADVPRPIIDVPLG